MRIGQAWTIGLLALAVVLAAGCSHSSETTAPCASGPCPVALLTSQHPSRSSDGCILLEVRGVLVEHRVSGLGVRKSSGVVRSVMWPFGWSARRDAEGIALVNRAGQVVARTGDQIAMPGGATADYEFICDLGT